ncbi:hypothetical protein AB0I60_03235 [Actinosynnema sp. NPDC050436]|uniref:hypothetical protein n=1 Tax=Actinosynnema sp. NPDC050436 TaxID=3155659 RepID=UPI0033FCED06
MSNTRRLLAELQSAASALLRRVLGTRREGGTHTRDSSFARARLDRVWFTEEYRYHQEISRNPSQERTDRPTGRIELTMPYDGADHFTRRALADVTSDGPTALPERALVGHLAVTDHSRTDLARVLDLTSGYGSAPITVPVAELGARDLVADRWACEIRHDYTPDADALRVFPVDVRVDLIDPDGTELHELLAMSVSRDDLMGRVAEEITKQNLFRSYLRLTVVVLLHLPNTARTRDLSPTVSRVSLRWPTITSLGALQLKDARGHAIPVEYNPANGSIEWGEIPMELVNERDEEDGKPHGDTLVFRSTTLHLRVTQPGELYKQPAIDGTVEVQVDDYLLSGVQARLFTATGTRVPERPRLRSRITTGLRLILDDAFARRLMLPSQHLYFDEVIPDDMRVSDVESALKEKGFEVLVSMADRGQGENAMRHLMIANRAAGPDVMQLWLLLEGRRFQTERQNQLPGGHTFKTTFDSGDLKLYLCGGLPGTSRELTQVMNSLQLTLRERFERLKARR